MAEFVPDEGLYAKLSGKVVVITGGATGIGAATTKLLAEHGAHIVVGDINKEAAIKTVEQLAGGHTYVETDQGNWFDPHLTIEGVREPGNTNVLDVNVFGTLNFARIATVFMRQDILNAGSKSLTLISSVNAFQDSPGLFLYQTSKHAVQGLLRSTRKTLYERDGIRVNAVCPGVTDTPMTAAIIDAFRDNGLFWQSPESVAKIVLGLMTNEEMNGKAVYVEGGAGFEFEDGLYAAQPHWLGQEATRRLRANTEAVQKGILVPKE
ncbi:Putative short-chain dehydrogenase/reductase SDR, NAD(P)-binding domain superfamily [Septoria linicola]|uniref:Short-chain dehydrogenase/reductase SDR, NAD(P)-binding domain superfamily n=1 Tax=Septoria linicola TaxID=215465 RepID=A0A9Q9ASE2_9PEZI|nr:putative short-chain dehydrogenase/reductase SDR, NAD(P)-binding domain superfamily [Septoria linicola]USW54559.1 Putative short-chain dehydrogenase/reductase SDR, NAD(P)-binding domain superfamily [Septoria linicola]